MRFFTISIVCMKSLTFDVTTKTGFIRSSFKVLVP